MTEIGTWGNADKIRNDIDTGLRTIQERVGAISQIIGDYQANWHASGVNDDPNLLMGANIYIRNVSGCLTLILETLEGGRTDQLIHGHDPRQPEE